MGTGASIQTPEGGPDAEGASAFKPRRGPLPVEGQPYEFYPALCSASARPNNLTAFDDTLVFASRNRVAFVEMGESKLYSNVFRSDGMVYQTKACTIMGPSGLMRVLVVAQAAGLVLWNFDEQKRLGRHSIAASEFSEKRVAFARGITSSEDQILVGCSTGQALCFDCEGQLGAALNVSEFAITDLVYCRSPDDTQRHLAVAAADGSIAVWSCSTKERPADLTKDFVLQPPRSTTLAVSLVTLRGNSLVVAGFTCGHIRVYSIVGRALVVEIAAHARPISTLAASRHRSQILSAGEDSVLNLWTVAEDSVTLDFSHKLQNTMVVGGCFVGEKDSALAVSAYDYDGVFAWTLPKSAKP